MRAYIHSPVYTYLRSKHKQVHPAKAGGCESTTAMSLPLEAKCWKGGQCCSFPPLYGTDRKMSTVPFNHLASNHFVIIPLHRLAGEEGKESEGKKGIDCMSLKQNMER